MNAHKRTTWTGLALRGDEWKRIYSRYQKIVMQRNGVALGIADLCDMGLYPISGKNLRRYRRLVWLARSMYQRLYSHPLRAESPPLGGIDG